MEIGRVVLTNNLFSQNLIYSPTIVNEKLCLLPQQVHLPEKKAK